MLKCYKIIKIMFANSMPEAMLNEHKGELVEVSLDQDVQSPLLNKKVIGFKKNAK